MKNFGAIVIVLGIIMVTMTGFNIVTRKQVPDVGSIEIKIKKEEIVPEEYIPVIWSPVTGGILILVGTMLVVVTGKRKRKVKEDKG